MFASSWCTKFHPDCAERGQSADENRALKQRLVVEGIAHAALVYDGDRAVAWAEYGSPEELPSIQHRKEFLATVERLPDYRVTCILVEGYPHDTGGVGKKNSSFLHNGTRTMCGSEGFAYDRPKGHGNCVVVGEVAPGSRE